MIHNSGADSKVAFAMWNEKKTGIFLAQVKEFSSKGDVTGIRTSDGGF